MRRILTVFLLSLVISGPACSELLNAEYRPLAGKEKVSLCKQYDGKVLLIVNTASKCGFTPQYEGLEKLHAKYADKGFAVLGFPSNDFMQQEPGSEQEIQAFCTLTYGVKFPMFEKSMARLTRRRCIAGAAAAAPSWNFYKYLVGRDGKIVGTSPAGKAR